MTEETKALTVFDRGKAEAEANAATVEATTVMEIAKTFEVRNAEENQQAADLQNEWKARAKAIEAIRLTLKTPITIAGREVDNLFNPSKRAFEEAAAIISKPMAAYDARLEEGRRKEQARLDAIAEKERKEREALAEKNRQQAESDRKAAEEVEDPHEREMLERKADRADTRADMHLEKAATLVAPIVRQAPTPEGLVKVKVRTFDEAAINLKELAQAAIGGINVMIVDEDVEVAPGRVAYLLAGGQQLVVTSVPPRPELLNCLKVNTGKLRKLIAGVEDTLTIPGVPIIIETRFRSTRTANV